MLKLNFENHSKNSKIKKSFFEKLFRHGLKIIKREFDRKLVLMDFNVGQIDLTIVSDKEIKILNKDYRGKNNPTDVLSFSYLNEQNLSLKSMENLIGEIIISAETGAKQAHEHKKTLKQELQFLFVHGLLHIFNYDHEKPDERTEMFDLHDEILNTKIWRKIID